jgi:hypothetical protein
VLGAMKRDVATVASPSSCRRTFTCSIILLGIA